MAPYLIFFRADTILRPIQPRLSLHVSTVTPSLQHKPTGSDGPGPLHRWSGIATVVGTVIGGLSLIVALLAWWLPRQNSPDPTSSSAGAATAGSTPIRSAVQPPAGAPAVPQVFLDGGSLIPEAGTGRLTELPRVIRGNASYASHPIAIKCPSNEADNQVSEVTYLLRGRYVQFDATVHPYYPPGSDQQAATYVTAVRAIMQRDGDLNTTEAGVQKRANLGMPAPLTAAIDNAEKLILRVQCGDPNGTVVLTDARLTPR